MVMTLCCRSINNKTFALYHVLLHKERLLSEATKSGMSIKRTWVLSFLFWHIKPSRSVILNVTRSTEQALLFVKFRPLILAFWLGRKSGLSPFNYLVLYCSFHCVKHLQWMNGRNELWHELIEPLHYKNKQASMYILPFIFRTEDLSF